MNVLFIEPAFLRHDQRSHQLLCARDRARAICIDLVQHAPRGRIDYDRGRRPNRRHRAIFRRRESFDRLALFRR